MPPALNKRIVGLPAWAWIAVLAGGLTIGLILRSRNNAADTTAADAEYTDETMPVSDPYADPYGEDYAYTGNPSYLLSPSSGYGGSGDYTDYSDQVYQGAYDAVADYAQDAFNSDETPTSSVPDVNVTIKPGAGDARKCGKKPSSPPGRNKHWECKGGRWRAVKDSGGGGGGGGGGGNDDGRNGGHHNGGHGNNGGQNKLLTGGGAPKRLAVHTPPAKRAPVPVRNAVGGNRGKVGKKK